MGQVESIIKKFGGVRPMARLVGRHPSNVHYWKRTGRIPDWHLDTVRRVAAANGIELDGEAALSPEPEQA